MLRQFKFRRMKIIRGYLRTRFGDGRNAYAAGSWWDEKFFVKGMSDRQTISPEKDVYTAAYHYASVELLILRHLRNNRLSLKGLNVCDLGSGSGHWLRFYRSFEAASLTGVDISAKSVEYLRECFSTDPAVTIQHGKIHEVLGEMESNRFDVVNAIGVMFHLVDDQEWEHSVREIARVLKPGGYIVIGGHFGWLNHINVQFDSENRVNKRLRSGRHWKSVLRGEGFDRIQIHRNHAYLHIDDSLPENDILIAHKPL